MGNPIQLEPFAIGDDEERRRRRALRGLQTPAVPARNEIDAQEQRSLLTPTQADVMQQVDEDRERADAQARGDEYRAMPDAQADEIESTMRRGTAGEAIYPSIPPPEPQRQRMMDRREARAEAANAGQMAALDAPTDRQRPGWMTDAPDPAADLEAATPRERVEDLDLEELLGSPSPKDVPPAGGAKASPPPETPPAGRDYTGADVGDVFRGGLHALGNAFSAAAGRPTMPFRSEGRELREQDRQDALRAEQQASRDRAEATRAGLAREQMAAQRQGREESAALQREGMDRQDARAVAQMQQRAELAQSDPNRQRVMDEVEQRRQLRMMDSEATQRARADARAAIATLPPQMRSLYSADIDQMTGEQALRYAGPVLDRNLSIGVRGTSGTSGPPRAPGGRPQGPSPAATLAIEAGMTQAEIAAFGPSAREQERLRSAALARLGEGRREQARRERTGARDDEVIVPGWHQTTRVPLSAPTIGHIQGATAELGRLRGAVSRMNELAQQISTLERAGASAGVLSERMGEAAAIHESISNALRRVGGYGVPNGTELERMEALAPRLNSANGIVNAVNAYRGILRDAERNHRDWMRDGYGLEPDAPGQRPAQRPQAPSGRRRVRLQDGRTGTLPANAQLPQGAEWIDGS